MSGQPSIRDTFFEECEELLEALVEGLAEMEDPDHSKETVNAVFRAVHSIKGGAGAFGLDELVSFAHAFETVLDKVRSDTLDVDPDLLRLFQRAGDQLADLVEASRDDRDPNRDIQAVVLAELHKYLGEEDQEEEFVFEAMGLDFDTAPAFPDIPEVSETPSTQTISIRFAPKPALFENGHEPLLLFDALAELGTLTVSADTSAVPAFGELDPSDPRIVWHLSLVTGESETVLHELFEFVRISVDISISLLPPTDAPREPPKPVETPEARRIPTQTSTPEPLASPGIDDIDRDERGGVGPVCRS